MKAVAISQPMLFPWPGFFEQLASVDHLMWLDDTQFSRGSFTNRVQIVHDGKQKWLTVPISDAGSFPLINKMSAARDFRSSHLEFLRQAFSKAPFKKEALALVEEAYEAKSLSDVLIASAEIPARYLGVVPTAVSRSSQSGVDGTSWKRVLELVQSLGGDRYLTGHGARHYMDHQTMQAGGVFVEYMVYSKTPWPQLADQFSPFVSVLDLIANTGPEARSYLSPGTMSWPEAIRSLS